MKHAKDYLHIKHSGGKDREKCLVVSDLHLGAPYSDAYEAETLLREQLEDKSIKHCVLLGDIYEGVNLPNKKKPGVLEKQAKLHMDHLRKLVQDYPHVSFHYVVGNHERLPEFDREIDKIESEFSQDRLSITRHFIKIGNGIFMHGDQAMNPKKYGLPDELNNVYDPKDHRYVESYNEVNRADWWQAVHNTGNVYAPWTVGRMFHRAGQCARAIFSWAHEFDARNPSPKDVFPTCSMTKKMSIMPYEGILSDVKHIFMGHTHDPFTGKQSADKRTMLSYVFPFISKAFTDELTGLSYIFHNTGASVYRAGIQGRVNRHCFNALNFYLNADNSIDEVHSINWPKHHWVDGGSDVAKSHIAAVMGQSGNSQLKR